MVRWIGVLLVIGFLLAPAADGFVLAAPITVPVGPGQLRSLVADPSRGVIGIPLDLIHVPLRLFDAVEATITRVSRGQAAGDTRERREDGGRR